MTEEDGQPMRRTRWTANEAGGGGNGQHRSSVISEIRRVKFTKVFTKDLSMDKIAVFSCTCLYDRI